MLLVKGAKSSRVCSTYLAAHHLDWQVTWQIVKGSKVARVCTVVYVVIRCIFFFLLKGQHHVKLYFTPWCPLKLLPAFFFPSLPFPPTSNLLTSHWYIERLKCLLNAICVHNHHQVHKTPLELVRPGRSPKCTPDNSMSYTGTTRGNKQANPPATAAKKVIRPPPARKQTNATGQKIALLQPPSSPAAPGIDTAQDNIGVVKDVRLRQQDSGTFASHIPTQIASELPSRDPSTESSAARVRGAFSL